MVSSLDPAYSLTIYNASSTPYTLHGDDHCGADLCAARPGYQGWSYWVFRKRLTTDCEAGVLDRSDDPKGLRLTSA